MSCSSITDEKKCHDTYFCIWEQNTTGGNGTCNDPSAVGISTFFTEWNPGCYTFDGNQTNCQNVSGCTWDSGTSQCNSNSTIQSDGLKCGYFKNDSNLCNSIAALSSCCTWNNGTCTENRFSDSCRQNLKETPEGAAFCEDWKAYDSYTLCTQLIGAPWFMACKWDNSTKHCTFNAERVFGTKGGGFEEINNQKNCEIAGGAWVQEAYCNGNKTVSSGRCEPKFDQETNCNKACYGCEKQSDGSAWDSLADAKTACEDSALGFCAFQQNAKATNGFGFCEPKKEFISFGGKSCESDCGACTFMGNVLEGEPQEACKNSKANCTWISDPSDNSKGFCSSSSEKGCNDRCDKCYSQNNCNAYGKGGGGNCTWDTATLLCKSSQGSSSTENCYDGVDNDGDKNVDCADSGCFSDSFCGGGLSGPNCFGYNDNTTCSTNNCTWITEQWGSWCDQPGAKCFSYDKTNETTCENITIVGTDCEWHTPFGGGFCEVPETSGNQCWNYQNQTSCSDNSNCTWTVDTYCSQNPASCGGKAGWCEYKAYSCWKNYNQTSCSSQSGCVWYNDTFGGGHGNSTGGHCDNACFAQTSQSSCQATNATGNTACSWSGGFCDPKGYGGGSAGGTGGFANTCYQYDGNQTGCQTATGCSWFTNPQAFCSVDFGSDCPQYTTSSACGANSKCKWANQTATGGGEWCDEKPFECQWNSTLQTNQSSCQANSLCIWKNDTFGARCEPQCFSNSSVTNNQTACQAKTECRWQGGFCNPSLQTELFKGAEFGEPLILGTDTDEDAQPDSADLTGFGMKDMGGAYGFGIRVKDMSKALICKGQPVNFGTATGNGNESQKFYWYLDTDGSSTAGCAVSHDATKIGFEFQLRYVITQDSTTKQASETFSAFKCVSGSWGITDIKLSSDKFFMCNEIGGGMIAIDKDDLNKFPDLYKSTADIRVLVATGNSSNSTNHTNPTDFVTTGGYATPGSFDFTPEQCWQKGADADGDGLTSENDPECSTINKYGYVPSEDCFPSGVDEDGNGLSDCNDYACAGVKVCEGKGVNAADYVDNKAPTLKAVKTEVYPDEFLILYDSDEPSNGTMMFYRNLSTCATLNASVHDLGITSTFVANHKTWHEAQVYNGTLNYTLSANTTYYYKLKLCDTKSNCAISACLNITTAASAAACGTCNFVAKIDPPTGWNISYDINQSGNFTQQGAVCGNTKNAGVLTNYTEGRDVDIRLEKDSQTSITFINAQLTKTILNSESREIEDSGSIKDGTKTTAAGTTVNYAGLDRETKDKLITALHPEKCRIKIPKGTDACTKLFHCDEDVANCVDRTSEATLNESGTNYCIWDLPNCEFSTWAGGNPAATSTSSSSSSGGGGGGGGGGGALTTDATKAAEAKATVETPATEAVVVTIPVAAEGQLSLKTKVSEETLSQTGVQDIVLNLKKGYTNLKIEVAKLAAPPAEASAPATATGKTYGYLKIETNVQAADLTEAKVQFKVEQSWLTSNNIDKAKVKLNRFVEGSWNVLATASINEDASYVYYEATTPGFSTFAITGEEKAPVTTEDVSQTTKSGISMNLLIVLAVIVLAGLVAYFVYQNKK